MSTAPDVLAELLIDDPTDQQRLRRQLAERAERSGELQVAYRTVDSPVGQLLVAGTPRGLVRVAYPHEGHDAVLQQLADRIDVRVLWAPARLDPVARQLDEYFTGRRTRFDVALDLAALTGFRQQVLALLAQIPYGATASYAQVAADAGRPAAVRAVGTACASNPVPVVVPCHRVVRSDGQLGQYLGGVAAKRTLLALEGCPT